MSLYDDLVLLFRPLVLADAGVEVVVPALAALLADPARQVLGDEAPILGPVAFDQRKHELVLFLGLH